jgi:guanylate kinase
VIVVVSGPGGVGKGTAVARLLQRDPLLWLSRSWTTRPPRPGEGDDAYVFVDRETFEARVQRHGFLEWAEFLGNYYGTPTPDDLPAGHDLLLEIEVQGASQVRESAPDALVIVLVPPSPEVQRERLVGRGDPADRIEARVEKATEELEAARALEAVEIVNDDLDETVDELLRVIASARSEGRG